MNSKIFFKRRTDALMVKKKTYSKGILSHLKKSSPTKLMWYKLICEHVFCDHISTLMIQIVSKFAIKSTFAFDDHCKKHLLTPKGASKETNQSKTLFGVAWKHKMLHDITHYMTSGRTPSDM